MTSAGTPSNSVLASIFILSMLLMFLVPYTLSRIFSRSKPKQVAVKRVSDTQSQWGRAASAQAVKQRSGAFSQLGGVLSPGNVALVLLWLLAAGLMLHIRSSAEEVRPFDPFDILGVTPGATDKEIKRAYRQLSLKFHPDKNPDPAAASYFAEFISPAYKALTDETARANLEKHGHPDGPQGMSVGVALPAFLFEKGRAAPFVLGAIVGIGILLPLAAVVCYITRQSQYTSSNIQQRTLYNFVSLTEQKNSLTTSKVADILVYSLEVLQMPVRRSEEEPLQKLAAELRGALDVKDPKFTKLHPACKKALILLHAQLARQGAAVPELLQADFLYLLGKAPALLDELLKITLRPRPPFGHFWLRPVLSVLEFNQSLTQAVPVGSRPDKPSAASDGSTTLMQLPHVDANGIKKLNRSKIRSLYDLMVLDDKARNEAVDAVGLTPGQRKDFETFVSAIPCVSLDAYCDIEGEESSDILEGDIATCNVHVCLERLGATAAMQTPFFPGSKEEGWWVLLADVSSNALLAAQKVVLTTQKGLGKFRTAAQTSAQTSASSTSSARPGGESSDGAGAGSADKVVAEGGVIVPLKFRAPPSGLHLLQVMCVSDYWVGCDRAKALKLKVGKMSRAQKRDAAAEEHPSERSEAGGDDADGEAQGSDSDVQGDDVDDLTESGTSESSGEDE